jgi:hypothetical protein
MNIYVMNIDNRSYIIFKSSSLEMHQMLLAAKSPLIQLAVIQIVPFVTLRN